MTYLPSEDGFLGLPAAIAGRPDAARAVIVPFGLEASVSYGGGTAAGPQAIIEASHEVELFDEELWKEPFHDYGVATLAPLVPAQPIEAALLQLEAQIDALLAEGKFPLILGGEHSLTPGAIRPYLKRWPDLTILQIDAHADLRDGYDGEPFSHAAAMRRCLDHEGVSLIGCGIRNISAEEIPFLEANRRRIQLHWAKDKRDWSINDIVAPLKGKAVYVTVDLDGFDSSLMPATGTPEPGGLFWEDVMDILRAASRAGTIVGGDIVELAPIKGFHAPDFLAAKLAYKLLSFALANESNP